MPAHLKDAPETKIRVGIYLTALVRWEERYPSINKALPSQYIP